MKVLKFILYCIECMLNNFSAMLGRGPDNYSIKEVLIGFITLVVVTMLILVILRLTGVIKFKKKDETEDKKWKY